MKKTLAIGAFALALTGCTVERIVEPAPTPTTEYVPPVTQVVDREQNYLNGLVADYPGEVSYLGKAKTIELGRLMCQAIDEGTTLQDLVAMAASNNVDAGFIGAVVRESVENFCPENQWFIDSALNA